MADVTAEMITNLTTEVLAIAPSGRLAELEADIKAKANFGLDVQFRFLSRVRDAFEAAEFPSTNAATTPTANVAPSAPT